MVTSVWHRLRRLATPSDRLRALATPVNVLGAASCALLAVGAGINVAREQYWVAAFQALGALQMLAFLQQCWLTQFWRARYADMRESSERLLTILDDLLEAARRAQDRDSHDA